MAESAFALELAESLAQDDIPIKLRCASCNKLVVNAFRLPCCDQSVCEPCQQNLPNECPVCAHTPLSSDDCKPNKALRLTVRAFLKNEEKKRDKSKENPNSGSQAPVAQDGATSEEASGKAEVEQRGNAATPTVVDASTPVNASTSKVQGEEDIKTSIESPGDTTEIKKEGDTATSPEGEDTTTGDNEGAEHQYEGDMDDDQQLNNNAGLGMSGTMNSQAWNPGEFNPMMAMQNTMMNPTAFGGFPSMMGMPMGMDPMMMSQGIFGGFNGAGMGMGGMNMGMGFDGNMGGWGNQASMGMMSGDFGANPGFFPGGGYNHQQSNHMHNQQFQNERYHQNRFNRGRGYFQRGGFNRDRGRPSNYNSSNGWNQQPRPVNGSGSNTTTDPYSNQHAEAGPQEEPVQPSGVTDSNDVNDTQDTKASQQADAAGDADDASHNYPTGTYPSKTDINQQSEQIVESRDTNEYSNPDIVEHSIGLGGAEPDVTLRAPQGPAAHFIPAQGPGFIPRGRGSFRGNYRGTFRGRGGFHQEQLPTQPPGPGVAGAPTGPKAMRDGFQNTSIRGRGSFHASRGVPTGPSAGFSGQSSYEQAEEGPAQPDEAQNPEPDEPRPHSRSRSPSRSPITRERKEYRSRSPNERLVQSESRINDDGDDYCYQADHHSGRFADDFADERQNEDIGDERASIPREEPAEEYRPRSHRQREEKYRSSRRGRDRSRSNSRGHKHRRHRSRSAQYEGRGDRDRGDRDRESHKRSRRERSSSLDPRERGSRGNDNDRHHRRRHSSRSRRDEGGELRQPAVAPNQPREFKIAGRSRMSQHQPPRAQDKQPDSPAVEEAVDPYLAERQQRDRERMAKEQESRGMAKEDRSGRKRSFADAGANGDDRHGNQRRRVSYYSDDNGDMPRGQRGEGRRDGRRWR